MVNSLQNKRGFLFDMDGTLYLGDRSVPGAAQLLSFLNSSHRKYLFLTNNSSYSVAQYQEKLAKMGLPATKKQILTSTLATILYLKDKGGIRIFPLGTPAFEQEMENHGFILTSQDPNWVVLAFDKTLTFQKICTAYQLIKDGVPFVATHPDILCPTSDGYIPDTGAMIALFQKATGISPTVIGKPQPRMVSMALKYLQLKNTEIAMVVDRLYTDIKMEHGDLVHSHERIDLSIQKYR